MQRSNRMCRQQTRRALPAQGSGERPHISLQNVLPRVAIGSKYVNMTDITSETARDGARPAAAQTNGPAAEPAVREALISCIELLFFAYRDFTGDPDAVLSEYGFGRAHHRVLHFVNRNPGIRVADLLDILKITKQSLARVLKQLVDEGFVIQRTGPLDRRERLLSLTSKGMRLTEKLTALQISRVETALQKAGPGASEATRSFLLAMIAEDDQPQVKALIRLPGAGGSATKGNGR